MPGVRTRIIVVEVWMVQGLSDNAEAAERNDELMDEFRDYCEDFIHKAGGSTLTVLGNSEDVELEHRGPQGPIYYQATRIDFAGNIREGRQSITV